MVLYIKDYKLYSELPLEITGLGERSYKDTFQLIFYKENVEFIRKSIFYGPVNTVREMTENNGVYTVNLVAKPYKLIIDTSEWTVTHKNIFLKEFQENFAKASSYYKKHSSKPQKQMFIFFLGDIDNRSQQFKVDNFKLLYFTFTDKFYLPKSEGNWQYNNIAEDVNNYNITNSNSDEVLVGTEPLIEAKPEVSFEIFDKVEANKPVKIEELSEPILKVETTTNTEQHTVTPSSSRVKLDMQLKVVSEESISSNIPSNQSFITKLFKFLIRK